MQNSGVIGNFDNIIKLLDKSNDFIIKFDKSSDKVKDFFRDYVVNQFEKNSYNEYISKSYGLDFMEFHDLFSLIFCFMHMHLNKIENEYNNEISKMMLCEDNIFV
jgi:hypothetical protein